MILKIPLAWLQLTRERIRLLVALSGIAFATILMFMQLGFRDALYDSAIKIHEQLHADLVLINPRSRALINMRNFSRRYLYQAASFEEVKSVSSLYIALANWQFAQDSYNRRILILGFEPKENIINIPEIIANLNKIKLPDVAFLDKASRPEFMPVIREIDQGKVVTPEIENRKIKIIGLFKVGASFGADATLITSDLNFLRIFPKRLVGEINLGLINLKPNAEVKKIQAKLQEILQPDIHVFTRQEFIAFEKSYWQNNTPIGFIFSLSAAMGFVVGIVIVYQVLYTDVTDHLAEYATLKAMGYTDIYLLGVVFQEALILSVLGYIPGFFISVILYNASKVGTSLPIAMTMTRGITVLILTIVMCCISGAIAVRKLSSADPADIF